METTTERTWEEVQARFEASLARLEAAVEKLQLINMDNLMQDEDEDWE